MANDAREVIREWLVRLSLSIPAAAGIADLAARIDQIADLLVAKVPPTLFTTDSLEFCLRRFKFFPSYAEVWGRIQTYQREQAPKLKALAAPDTAVEQFGVDAELPAKARVMVTAWLKDDRAGLRTDAEMTVSLSVLRRYSPDGYQWLVKGNLRAADIAVRRGWTDEEHRWSPPSEVEKDAVSAITRQVFRGVEMRTPDPQRPDASHILPGPVAVEAFEAKHGRPPGSLSPEHLMAVRMANPALRPIAEREASRHLAPANDHLPPENATEAARAPPGLIEAYHDQRKARPPMPWDDEP